MPGACVLFLIIPEGVPPPSGEAPDTYLIPPSENLYIILLLGLKDIYNKTLTQNIYYI